MLLEVQQHKMLRRLQQLHRFLAIWEFVPV
jgi:hypothetical protein